MKNKKSSGEQGGEAGRDEKTTTGDEKSKSPPPPTPVENTKNSGEHSEEEGRGDDDDGDISIPTAQYYEVSYMHRNVITHLAYSKTHYLITCSSDGHLKFWRLATTFGLEFVKHYRAHLGAIHSLAISSDGELACTVSEDKTAKIFDVVNFGNVCPFLTALHLFFANTILTLLVCFMCSHTDMISMMKLNIIPWVCCFVYTSSDASAAVAMYVS
ncbi:unnamed protein product [Dibothriocephalus latus]|uniref:Uncharacterized protein n=1 Tax=Dibothriocephalus latus TaxID=60516 RepID=A0A3P7MIC5_DIBLA|nr:unnamed protein product [Dibothriocephalus latus]